MTKKEIAARVALRTGITHKRAVAVIDDLLAEMKAELAAGGKVEFRGFGIFKTLRTKPKIGRNLSNNTRVVIAPGQRVKFAPGKDLNDAVRRATAA